MENSHSSKEPKSTQTMERSILLNDSINQNLQFINECQFYQSQNQSNNNTLNLNKTNTLLSSPELATIPTYSSSTEAFPMQSGLLHQFNPSILQLQNYHQTNTLISPEFNMLTSSTKSESEIFQESIQYQQYLPMQNPISPTLQLLETQLAPRPLQSLTWPLPVYPMPECSNQNSIDPQTHLIPNLQPPPPSVTQIFGSNNSLKLTPQNYSVGLNSKPNYTLKNQYQGLQFGQSSQSNKVTDKGVITPPPPPPLLLQQTPMIQDNLTSPARIFQQQQQHIDFINFTITNPNNKSQTTSKNSGTFNCAECSMTFNRKNSLRRHTQLHRGEKPFYCPACKKNFSRLDIFKRHKISRKCIELSLKLNSSNSGDSNNNNNNNAEN